MSPSRIKQYFSTVLSIDTLVELQLLLLTFSTGVQDAIAFPDFNCFASNQTGNSVVLAIGAAGLGGANFSLANVGTSLGMFLAGAVLTGQIANIVGPRRRGWLLLNHLIQTLLVFASAIIQRTNNGAGAGYLAMISISFLAFSSGAQVASMRPMRIQEITTAMATAAWVDFVIDAKLFALDNHSRDRRGMFLLTLIGGSFVGAFMYKALGSSNTLMFSASGKLLVTASFVLNRAEKEQPTMAMPS